MNIKKVKRIALIVGAPVVFALIMRLFFGLDAAEFSLWGIMSLSFLVGIPMGVGMITIYLSDIERVKNILYRIFIPWIPVFFFFFLTLVLSLEGWACWLMVLPFFLIAASIGGLIAGRIKINNSRSKEHLSISLIIILPLLIAPIENLIGAIPGTYEAYTSIVINADKEEIWNNVTRVPAIQKEQDNGWLTEFLGFPRPIKAELNFEGVGASREAIFDKGLIFHEVVKEYEHQQKLKFSIKANPYEIPSTTMDEHVVIGGEYFDVLDGTYELEKLNEKTYRLHLYSHFTLSTTFNFYASWWARWIMQDIQNNILQVVKQRAENP